MRVGDIWIGSRHPVLVQSMINEDTLDVAHAKAVNVCREERRPPAQAN